MSKTNKNSNIVELEYKFVTQQQKQEEKQKNLIKKKKKTGSNKSNALTRPNPHSGLFSSPLHPLCHQPV